jgi:hypothetical protein
MLEKSSPRAWGDREPPVTDGSACDLRAAAQAVDPARQLTCLVPVAPRPDACAEAPFRKFHFRDEIRRRAPSSSVVPQGPDPESCMSFGMVPPEAASESGRRGCRAVPWLSVPRGT